MSFKTYINLETIGDNAIDKKYLNIEDMMVSTTSPGMMSIKDKQNLDNSTVKTTTWDNDTDLSNMNDFVNVGVYDIKGKRTRSDDNLPILNVGGDTFNARLIVLDSSGSGEDDDKCITQVLSFSNSLGQGEVYIRTGKGSSLVNLTWENWSALQRNVNVREVSSLDGLVDNGIYSGVLTPTGETFVLVVINNYDIAQQVDMQQHISQLKYSLVVGTGEIKIQKRTCDAYGSWTEWYDINDTNDTPEIVHDCNNGSSFEVNIYPNKYYKFDNVSNLTVNFNQGQNGILKNYMFEVSFSGGNTLNLPLDIKWANGNAPIFVAGNTYQISVINNLGVFTEFY